jgi:hypothetical protein
MLMEGGSLRLVESEEELRSIGAVDDDLEDIEEESVAHQNESMQLDEGAGLAEPSSLEAVDGMDGLVNGLEDGRDETTERMQAHASQDEPAKTKTGRGTVINFLKRGDKEKGRKKGVDEKDQRLEAGRKMGQTVVKEDRVEGVVTKETLKAYISAGGGVISFATVIVVFIVAQVGFWMPVLRQLEFSLGQCSFALAFYNAKSGFVSFKFFCSIPPQLPLSCSA